jgi:hypothetical protein
LADKKKRREAAPELPPEERAAEAATVAWMLCALFTLCAEGVGLAARVALASGAEANAAANAAWGVLPELTLLMGLVTGTVGLVLTWVVYKLRKTPPPAVITVVAILLGLTPWMRLILGYLRGN